MACTLTIVGPGVVGTTLGVLAQRSGYQVTLVARDRVKAEIAAKYFAQPPRIQRMGDEPIAAGIVLLTVPDDQISVVAELIAPNIKPGSVVAHCSGALTSDQLTACAAAGAETASIHPLQTFPSVATALSSLANTHCYCEWTDSAATVLQPLLQALAMQVVEIRPEHKALYHAAAVMACNYFTSLIDAALELGEQAAIPRDAMWQSLQPLVAATLANNDAVGPVKALTGPIARGDSETVAEHIAALKSLAGNLADNNHSQLLEMYRILGRQALKLAAADLTDEQQQALAQVLS